MAGETKVKPWNTEIWTDSIETLRRMDPVVPGHTVDVAGYTYGAKYGGGKFVYDPNDTTTPDDGGYCIVTATGKRFKRGLSMDLIDVTHFGAVMDGVTDDMPAVARMHAWSRSIDATFGPGVRVPAGVIALSSLDLGTAEMPAFKFKGPDVEFGVAPKLRVIPISKTTTTPMFKYCARRTEISGFAAIGTGTVQPWFVNTVTRGAYVRIKSIVCRGTGGRMFQFIDTIDCKIDQIYSYSCTAGIVWVTWSNENPGVWDHPTAIELTNANFSSQKGEFAFSAIRCGQSIMRNVWFTACERGFDVSQGGWVFDTVIAEGPTAGGVNYAGQAKLTEIACRFAQGATVGRNPEDSGYDPSMDDGPINNGNKPSWVTNAMDQGRISLNTAGFTQYNGFGRGYDLPLPHQRFLNNTGNEKWVYIGKVVQNNTQGATFELDIQGANGYDSIPTNLNHPGSTGFGGGRALIRGQLKQPVASTTSLQLSWHGEGACPIKEVRYVHAWQNFDIYVRMGAFCRVFATKLSGDGVGRDRSGQPFYFREGSDTAIDISTIANLRVAKKIWSVNGGTAGNDGGFGFGMDLDNGQVVMAAATAGNAAAEFLAVKNKYEDRFIPMQVNTQSMRLPRYTLATMPAATDNPYGIILVSDAVGGNGVTTWRLCFSNGSFWFTANGGENLGAGTTVT